MEIAGWKVDWYKDRLPTGDVWDSILNNGRFLGTLATEASKDFETPTEAMKEFELITKQDITDGGCNCCGAPHSFTWGGRGTEIEHRYASGEECMPYLYGEDKPKSLREALELLKRK